MVLKHNKNLFFNGGCSQDYNTEDSCTDLEYLSAACKAVPVQIIKIDRVGLKPATKFLSSDNLYKNNIKLIYLVRDPRAVVNSRKSRSWCVTEPVCIDSRNLCNYIKDDYHVAKVLLKTKPDRFR